MSETPSEPKTPSKPHHRLSISDIQRDYEDGLITARGAIFYTVSASRKAGGIVRLNPSELCKKFAISRSTYYDAIAWCKAKLRIEIVADSEMLVRIPIDQKSGVPQYFSVSELSDFSDTQSEILDTQSDFSDNLSEILDTQSDFSDTQSDFLDTQSEKSENQRSERRWIGDSGSPSTNTAITTISLSTTSEKKERETCDLDPDYRQWLLNKARSLPNPPALMERWIEVQGMLESNKREYQQIKQSENSTGVSHTESATFLHPELNRLRELWQADDRETVYQELRDHPEWGITIGEVISGS